MNRRILLCVVLALAAATTVTTGEKNKKKPPAPVYTKWPFDAKEAKRRQKETAAKLKVPVEMTLQLGKGVTMKLALIPAGKFLMGSPKTEAGRDGDEGPQRQVTISRPFYIGLTEVTRGQFAAFASDSGYKTTAEKEGWVYAFDGKTLTTLTGASWRKVGFEQADTHPVVCVNWDDATAFTAWLGRKARRTVSLPTDAQWEYACRAGTATVYQWGDDPDHGKGWCNVADATAKQKFTWWKTFSWADGHVFTAPVASYKPNAWGLHDMHGNVMEWCRDWYDAKYYSANATALDPAGPAQGKDRVVRGGSWRFTVGFCRSAYRGSAHPVSASAFFSRQRGFRVVLPLVAPKPSK